MAGNMTHHQVHHHIPPNQLAALQNEILYFLQLKPREKKSIYIQMSKTGSIVAISPVV